jgi:hypothetical protein
VDVELRDLRWAIVASQHRGLRQAADARYEKWKAASAHNYSNEQWVYLLVRGDNPLKSLDPVE